MSAGEAPRTEAGRNILQALRKDHQPGTMGYMAADTWVPLIIAIEREAAAAPPEPPLDVERLDKVLRESSLSTIAWNEVHALLTEIAAEYARLSPSSGEAVHRWAQRLNNARVAAPEGLPLDVELLREVERHFVPYYGETESGIRVNVAGRFHDWLSRLSPSSGESGSAPELRETDAQGHDILHAVTCWCNPLKLAMRGESAHKPWCVLPPTHRYGCESALPDDHHSHTESSSGESE